MDKHEIKRAALAFSKVIKLGGQRDMVDNLMASIRKVRAASKKAETRAGDLVLKTAEDQLRNFDLHVNLNKSRIGVYDEVNNLCTVAGVITILDLVGKWDPKYLKMAIFDATGVDCHSIEKRGPNEWLCSFRIENTPIE